MRNAIVVVVTSLMLGGCLEKVDPISSIDNSVATGAVTLSWQPPTQNSDGTPLMDLAGYNVYVGTSSDSYDYRQVRLNNPGLTAYVVEQLAPDTYYFAATAFSSSGAESEFSEELVRTVN